MQGKAKSPSSPRKPVCLNGAQVSEFWVWLWAELEAREAVGAGPAADEASRLAVALDRAVIALDREDVRSSRFARDQNERSTARLAHYLHVRLEQWRQVAQQPERQAEARARLEVVSAASDCFTRLLGVAPSSMLGIFARLELTQQSRSSVFRAQEGAGVIIESLEEGPALPGEYKARWAECLLRSEQNRRAEAARPRRRRAVGGVKP